MAPGGLLEDGGGKLDMAAALWSAERMIVRRGEEMRGRGAFSADSKKRTSGNVPEALFRYEVEPINGPGSRHPLA